MQEKSRELVREIKPRERQRWGKGKRGEKKMW